MPYNDFNEKDIESFLNELLESTDLTEMEFEQLKERLVADGFNLDDLMDLERSKEMLVLEDLEETLEDYNLYSVPASSRLEDLLNAYTKDVLYTLGSDNGLALSKSWKKEKMVQTLHDYMMDTLSERIVLIGNRPRKLLERALNQDFAVSNLEKDETDFFMEVLPMLIKLGLVFANLTDTGQLDIIASDECMDALNNIRQHQNSLKPHMKDYREINKVLKATINLYGAAQVSRFFVLWEIIHPDMELLDEWYENVYRVLPILVAQNGYFFSDEGVIGHSDFEYKEAIDDFYWDVRAHLQGKFYMPSKRDIHYFGKNDFEREMKEYKNFNRFIKKVSPFPDVAMKLIEHHLRFSAMPSTVFEDLEELDLLELEGITEIETLFNHYLKLNNETRMWANAGFKPSENFTQ